VFTIVESEVGGWRLIGKRTAQPEGFFVPRSAVDAEREDLHVEVEAADWAAIEQFKRPGHGTGVGAVRRAVSKYLRAVRACGIGAAEAERLPELQLERRVFGPVLASKPGPLVPPDCAWIHGELKRHRHVTLQLLWEEYTARFGTAAYRRSAF
jgi:hypothetical protein